MEPRPQSGLASPVQLRRCCELQSFLFFFSPLDSCPRAAQLLSKHSDYRRWAAVSDGDCTVCTAQSYLSQTAPPSYLPTTNTDGTPTRPFKVLPFHRQRARNPSPNPTLSLRTFIWLGHTLGSTSNLPTNYASTYISKYPYQSQAHALKRHSR
ncbi:hypothetical protein BJX64DRAFT_262554 [Aspergillus heterothallicus]